MLENSPVYVRIFSKLQAVEKSNVNVFPRPLLEIVTSGMQYLDSSSVGGPVC